MGYKVCILMISMACSFLWCNGQERMQIRMTLLSMMYVKSEVEGQYQCRMSDKENGPNNVTVKSLRTGWTRNTAEENPDPLPASYQDRDYAYYRVMMTNNVNNNNFGVFGCNATKHGTDETIISTPRMRSDAHIVPHNGLLSQTVSVGDRNVTITMVNTTAETPVSSFRWRNNTHFWRGKTPGIDPNFGVDTFKIDGPVQLYHAGIYECHKEGERWSAMHGLNLLIVRACPSTRWGPPDCDGVCDSCYNGGVCDENTGKCVCAPGFQGKKCLTVCGGNRYGYDCEHRFTHKVNEDACGGTLFCLVHPFGCRCNTGFRGLDCTEVCEKNTFGASCLQSCHCSSDACNRFTGECKAQDNGSTSCQPGWRGDFCQECVDGYFGSACDKGCHCHSDKCNRESGLCQSGGCLPQWVDLFPPYSCQTGLVTATSQRVNALVPVPVNCTAVIGQGGNIGAVDFVLSRSPDDLDDENITSNGTYQTGNTATKTFLVDGVNQDLTLYCQLRTTTDRRVAVLTVNVSVYELPTLSSSPHLIYRNSTTIRIGLAAWDEAGDKGTPPIVSYNLYYKLSNDSEWKNGDTYGTIEGQVEYNATFNGLNPDTLYNFSVAAVREGQGGEGEMGPPLEERTICDVPLDGPQEVVTDIAGEKQELVQISWKLPPYEAIRCSRSVLQFNIYYSSTSFTFKEEIKLELRDISTTSFTIANLEVGEEYIFEMTLITEGGESNRSEKIHHLVSASSVSAYIIAVSIVIPVVSIFVVTMVCFMRYGDSQKKGSVPKVPSESKYENEGSGDFDEYASIEKNQVKTPKSDYEDLKLKKISQVLVGNTSDFYGYEVPASKANVNPMSSSIATKPEQRLTDGEEYLYEAPDF